jgi:hypothetical protein
MLFNFSSTSDSSEFFVFVSFLDFFPFFWDAAGSSEIGSTTPSAAAQKFLDSNLVFGLMVIGMVVARVVDGAARRKNCNALIVRVLAPSM